LFQALERALTGQNQNVKVLVVEDDLDLARVLTAMFERHSIETFHRQERAINSAATSLLLVLDGTAGVRRLL